MPYQPKTPWDYAISGVQQGAGMGPQILQTLFQEKALREGQEERHEERMSRLRERHQDIAAKIFSIIGKAKTPEEAESYRQLSENVLDSLGIYHKGAPEFVPAPAPGPSIKIGEQEITGPLAEILGRLSSRIQEEALGLEPEIEKPVTLKVPVKGGFEIRQWNAQIGRFEKIPGTDIEPFSKAQRSTKDRLTAYIWDRLNQEVKAKRMTPEQRDNELYEMVISLEARERLFGEVGAPGGKLPPFGREKEAPKKKAEPDYEQMLKTIQELKESLTAIHEE